MNLYDIQSEWTKCTCPLAKTEKSELCVCVIRSRKALGLIYTKRLRSDNGVTPE